MSSAASDVFGDICGQFIGADLCIVASYGILNSVIKNGEYET